MRLDPAVFDAEQAARLHEALGTDATETPDPAVVFGEQVGELLASVAGQIEETETARADQLLSGRVRRVRGRGTGRPVAAERDRDRTSTRSTCWC